MNTTIKKRIEEINSGRVPEGYEKTSFSIFPCDWENVKLSEISEFCGGGTPSTKIAKYWEGNIPWISSSDIREGDLFNVQMTRYITKEAIDNSATKLCPKGSIAVVTRVGVGKLAYIACDYCTSQDFTNIIRCSINKAYLLYKLYSAIQKHVEKAQGTSIKGITTKELSEIVVSYPQSAQEQSRIAEILMQWDKAIELQEKLIKSYQKLKKYYLSKMFPKKGSLYPEIRFAGFTEPWEDRQVFEIAYRFDNLRVPVAANLRASGNIPYYGANGIQDYVNGFTHDGEFVLVAEDGANDLINYPVQYVNGRIWVNNHAHVLQGKPNLMDNLFFAYSLHRADIASYLVGGSRAKLNADTLMMLELKVPSIVEQRKIGRLFDSFDKRTNLHQSALNHLIKQRKALQQYLLTGIVRV